jgi:hypothetical protein
MLPKLSAASLSASEEFSQQPKLLEAVPSPSLVSGFYITDIS